MQSITLKVPYTVVSSVMRDDDEVEKRVQTPFGSVDISMRFMSGKTRLPPAILVEANFALAAHNAQFTEDFFQNLANFSYEIARRNMDLTDSPDCILELRFMGDERVRHLKRAAGSSTWCGLERTDAV